MGHRAAVRAAAGAEGLRRLSRSPDPPGATENADARFDALDTWPAAMVSRALWEGQLAAVAALEAALPALTAATEAATARLRASEGGRLVYVGAGSSGRLAAGDGAELLPTFDWPDERLLLLPAGGLASLTRAIENAEDDTDAARNAVRAHAIGAADVMVGLAASGGTPFTVAALQSARQGGALTIGIANSADTPLLRTAEHQVLLATGAEAIAGSTRMKAGTAQKVALNLLSTGIMVGLGRVHRGRMVEMRPRNAKLRARACAMVADLAGVDRERARRCLEAADGAIKLAVLLAHGLDHATATAALRRAGGVLRVALAEQGPRP